MPSGELLSNAFAEALLQIESEPGYFGESFKEAGVIIFQARGLMFEMRKVDPHTVKHMTRNRTMSLSEVIEGNEALMLLITDRKGETHGPIYAETTVGLKAQIRSFLPPVSESKRLGPGK